jgi:uncharacterized membrane protein (UPF0127 family)
MIARVLVSAVALVLVACTGAATGVDTTGEAATRDPVRATGDAASPATATGLQPSEGFAVSAVAFTDGGQRIPMRVLVADTAELRTTGLMGRAGLPDDAGMLFVWDAPTSGGFWRKNTTLPLSIAFVGRDGMIHTIMDMEPCTADPCPTYTPDASYVHAVEANQGYFVDHGITPGWSLEVDVDSGGG